MIPSQFWLVIFILTAAVQADAQAAYRLDDCFLAALKHNQSIAIEEEQIKQAEERYSRASGSFLPSINGVASYTRLPKPSGAETAFTRVERPEIKITATQPIFKGLREYAALRKSKADVVVSEYRRRAAEVLLYEDLAQNYYQILSFEQDLKNLNAQLELSRRRVSELEERRKIGRSRTSELLTVQSAVLTLEAQVATVGRDLYSAREAFVFLSGLDRNTELVSDDQLSPGAVEDLKVYLDKIETRPDIQALVKATESADESVSIAKGGHLPSVDVTANYYLKRTGIQESQKWDVTAQLVLPLYAGGSIQSSLREAASVRQQSELSLTAGRRKAEQEIRSYWQTTQINQIELKALARAAELAERNYNEQNKEYRYGLVNNLEVLQSLNTFQEARRSLDRARIQAKLNFVRLQAAAALQPSRQLGQGGSAK